MIEKKVKKLPDSPGVYFFLDSQKKAIYIGKATSLKDRVKSYLGKDILLTRGPLIEKMVAETKAINFKETESVLEALILEANLIKKHRPKYNSMGKDDKSWNYVAITDEEFPRVLTIRQKDLDSYKLLNLPTYKLKTVFGPFPHGNQLQEALKIIRRIFPFRDEKSKNPHTERFYRQIGLAPDTTSKDAKKEYKKNIRNINLFFDGKKQKIIRLLEKEMALEARKHNFEKSAELRNKIFALKHIQDIALLKTTNYRPLTDNYRIESYDIAHISGKFVVGGMVVLENGELKKSDYRKFKIRIKPGIDDTGALKEVIQRRLKHKEWRIPDLISVDGGIAQKRAAEVTTQESGFDIPVVSIVKNEKHKPEQILGDKKIVKKHQKDLLLANQETHRFTISYHRNLREKLI